MLLTLRHIVSVDPRIRSFWDRRKFVTRTVAEYRGDDGETYRKSFEAVGTPKVPEAGTHAEINALRTQWRDN